MVCLSKYIAPVQAAELIGCTRGRIYQLLRADAFKNVVEFGSHRLILRSEAEKIARNPSKVGRPRKKNQQ